MSSNTSNSASNSKSSEAKQSVVPYFEKALASPTRFLQKSALSAGMAATFGSVIGFAITRSAHTSLKWGIAMGACKGIQQATHFSWLHFNNNRLNSRKNDNNDETIVHDDSGAASESVKSENLRITKSKSLAFVQQPIGYNIAGLCVGAVLGSALLGAALMDKRRMGPVLLVSLVSSMTLTFIEYLPLSMIYLEYLEETRLLEQLQKPSVQQVEKSAAKRKE